MNEWVLASQGGLRIFCFETSLYYCKLNSLGFGNPLNKTINKAYFWKQQFDRNNPITGLGLGFSQIKIIQSKRLKAPEHPTKSDGRKGRYC